MVVNTPPGRLFSFAFFGLLNLTVLCALASATAPVVVERFDSRPAAGWQVEVIEASDGIFDWRSGEDGLVFRTPQGNERPGLAVMPWPIGQEPFELNWRVELTGGQYMNNRAPAIHVGVATAPPEETQAKEAITIQMGVGHAGVSGGVSVGSFMVLNQNETGHPPFRTRYMGRWIDGLKRSAEGMGNQGWFEGQLRNQTITLQLRRTEAGTLIFTAWHHDIGLEAPWWQEEIDLPAGVEKADFRYLLVMVSPNRNGAPLHGPQSRVAGVVMDLQARPLSEPRPVVQAVSPAKGVAAAGEELIITGRNFGSNPVVTLDGRVATVRKASDTEIRVMLPSLTEGVRYPLEVRHANGLIAGYPAGVGLGRMLEAVRPREAHPDGGDVVTLHGAGFDNDTIITFGGKPAEIVERIDPTQVRLRVPSGSVGLAKVEASSGGKAFSGDPVFAYAPHPYIMYGPDELEDIRKKFNQPLFANYRQAILAGANQEVDMNRLGGSDAYNPAYYLWMAYLMTGEQDKRDRLMDVLEVICAQRDHHQFQIQKATIVATVYDSLFHELSPDERQMMIEYLDRSLDQYLERTGANDWWFANNPSNTITVGANGGGLAALALMHSRPEDAKRAIETAARLIHQRYHGIAEDGGSIEGTLYWDYGLTQQIMLGHAFEKALGTDHGLLSQKRLEKGVDFAMSQMGGAGFFFVNNNTQPWLTGVVLGADFGSRYDQPFMRWLADEILRLWVLDAQIDPERKRMALFTRAKFIVCAFFYRDDEPSPEQIPALPTAIKLPAMQWATIRSGPESRGPLVLNVKGHEGPLAHHKQPDKGNFQLHGRGEAFIITPGYYSSQHTDLSVPLIDGRAGDMEAGTAAPITVLWEKGDVRGISIDASAPYAKTTKAQRVKRHFVMVGDDTVVVLDDIVPGKRTPGNITVQWQAHYQTTTDGRTATIIGDDSALRIEPHGPALELEVEGPRDFGRSWVYRTWQERDWVSWHSTRGKYQADEARPLVTVLQLMPKGSDATAANRIDYGADRIRVLLSNGRRVEFSRGRSGWEPVQP